MSADVRCELCSRVARVPDAVFCYNDLTAIGAMHATLEAGLSIPQDIAFIGCGNVRYSDYLRIPLSSSRPINRPTG